MTERASAKNHSFDKNDYKVFLAVILLCKYDLF